MRKKPYEMDLHRLRVLNFSNVSNANNETFQENDEKRCIQPCKAKATDYTIPNNGASPGKDGKKSATAIPNTSKSVNKTNNVNKAGPVYKIPLKNRIQKPYTVLRGSEINAIHKNIKSNFNELNGNLIQNAIDGRKSIKKKRRRHKRSTELEVLFSRNTSNLINNNLIKGNVKNLKAHMGSKSPNKYLFSRNSHLNKGLERRCNFKNRKGKSLHPSAKRYFYLYYPLSFIRSRRNIIMKSAPNSVYTMALIETNNPFRPHEETNSVKTDKPIKKETRKVALQGDGSLQKPSLLLPSVTKKSSNHNNVCKQSKPHKHIQWKKSKQCWSYLSFFRNRIKRQICQNKRGKNIITIGDDCRCEPASASCVPSLLKARRSDYCLKGLDCHQHVRKQKYCLSSNNNEEVWIRKQTNKKSSTICNCSLLRNSSLDRKNTVSEDKTQKSTTKFLEVTSNPLNTRTILAKERIIKLNLDKRCEELENQNIKRASLGNRNTLKSNKILNSLKRKRFIEVDKCECQNPSFCECPQMPKILKQRKIVLSALFLIIMSPYLLIKRLWQILTCKNKIIIPTSQKQRVKTRLKPLNKTKFSNRKTQTTAVESRIRNQKHVQKHSEIVKKSMKYKCRVKDKSIQSKNIQNYNWHRWKKLMSWFKRMVSIINPLRGLNRCKRKNQRRTKNKNDKMVTKKNVSTSISNNLLKPNIAPITPPLYTSTPRPVRLRNNVPDPKKKYKLFFHKERGWMMKPLYGKYKCCKFCGELNLFHKICNTKYKTPKQRVPHILKHDSYIRHAKRKHVKCSCPKQSIFQKIYIRCFKNPTLYMTRTVQDVEAQWDTVDPCQSLYNATLRRKPRGFIYNNYPCLYTLYLTMRKCCGSSKTFCLWCLCVFISSPCVLICYFLLLIIRFILCML